MTSMSWNSATLSRRSCLTCSRICQRRAAGSCRPFSAISRYLGEACAAQWGCRSNNWASPAWPICGQASAKKSRSSGSAPRCTGGRGGQPSHGLRHAGRDLRIQRRGAETLHVQDAQCGGGSRLRARLLGGKRGAVRRIRAAHHLEQQARVGDGARQRADHLEVEQQAGQHVLARHRAEEGFSPTSPVCEAGRRIEPPPSCPIASGAMPAATAATAPPLEPPGVSARFQGLRVAPKIGLPV